MSTQCIFLPVRSSIDPTFCGKFVSGPLQFKCQFITSAEREVKHSRRLGMSQSSFVGDEIGHAKSVGFRFYSAI